MDDSLEKRKRGRPGTYANAAERARAWRERQKSLLATLNAQAREPKILEKIVEKPIYISRREPENNPQIVQAQVSKIIPIIREHLIGNRNGIDRARALRSNATRVATLAKDLLSFVHSDARTVETEKIFLRDVERFFSALSGALENTQVAVRVASVARDRAEVKRHEERLANLVVQIFGHSPLDSDVISLAEKLLAFEADSNSWLVKRYQVDRGLFFIARSSEFETAFRTNDIKKMMREAAYVRMDIGERGQRIEYDNSLRYVAGWEDFVRWCKEKK